MCTAICECSERNDQSSTPVIELCGDLIIINSTAVTELFETGTILGQVLTKIK
jgi:hypothetical protein